MNGRLIIRIVFVFSVFYFLFALSSTVSHDLVLSLTFALIVTALNITSNVAGFSDGP